MVVNPTTQPPTPTLLPPSPSQQPRDPAPPPQDSPSLHASHQYQATILLLPGPDDFREQPPRSLTCLLLRFLFQIAPVKICLFSQSSCEAFSEEDCPFDREESMPFYNFAMGYQQAPDNTIALHGEKAAA